MVADPVVKLVFTSGDFTHYGAKELKDDPALLSRRLDELVQMYGIRSKIGACRRQFESYSSAQYLFLLRFLATFLTRRQSRHGACYESV